METKERPAATEAEVNAAKIAAFEALAKFLGALHGIALKVDLMVHAELQRQQSDGGDAGARRGRS